MDMLERKRVIERLQSLRLTMNMYIFCEEYANKKERTIKKQHIRVFVLRFQ